MCGKSAIDIVQSLYQIFFLFIHNNNESSEVQKDLNEKPTCVLQTFSKKSTCLYQDEVHAVIFLFSFFFVCRMYKAEAGVICKKKKSGIYKTIKTGVNIQFTQSGS